MTTSHVKLHASSYLIYVTPCSRSTPGSYTEILTD